MPNRTKLLFETVRHLTVRQIAYQVYYRFVDRKTPEPMEAPHRRGAERWEFPSYAVRSTPDGKRFTFLGKTTTLSGHSTWNDPALDKLWLYNLHYLNDLNAVDAEGDRLARELLEAWIDGNPPVDGNGWEPYPLSLRIVNMIKWFARQLSLEPRWLSSLAVQAESLAHQIEHHILGNHILANGKALVFAGAFLNGRGPGEWLQQGLRILDQEVSEQLLEDGGHYERSPMYHAIIMWDLCDLICLAECCELPELLDRKEVWQSRIQAGLTWLATMVHPDGDISFFNDAAIGISPTLEDLQKYAADLNVVYDGSQTQNNGLKINCLQATGYLAVQMGEGHKAILDVAPVGPDYQPGHAHADTLSMELSLFGQRVIVNSGTSRYSNDSERHRQRSTAAHNTVEVANENSSEVWSGFRVARRAVPTLEECELTNTGARVRGSHNGYSRLKGRNIHTRQWEFELKSLCLTDEITGKFPFAVAYFHIHPDVEVNQSVSEIRLLLVGGQQCKITFEGAKKVTVLHGTWHPRFGQSCANRCIVVTFDRHRLITNFCWDRS